MEGAKKERALAKVRLMARRAVCGNLRKRGTETKFKEQQQNWAVYYLPLKGDLLKTSQELRMLSSVTINSQITKIVMNSGSQLSEL